MTRVGESAWLLRLPTCEAVLAALAEISSAAPREMRDAVPGADSLLVVFDDPPSERDASWLEAIERRCAALAEGDAGASSSGRRVHEIAVVYDGEDLPALARHAGIPPAEVIALHAASTYRVAFLGFQPGFAYLSGLPASLRMPRRATPRARVPAGSVAIGGEWTGIYPVASPGGWNLIGRSDVRLFDPAADPPALLRPGDLVRLVAR